MITKHEQSKSKIANTQHDVHELIRKRWSPRSFSERSIKQDDLETLFEAASWASSSMNEQPWRYIYAHRDDFSFHNFLDCLYLGNASWAKNASVLLLSLAKVDHQRNGSANRYHMHDVGAANSTLLLQAASMDIYGHMLGGFDMAKTKATFKIPDTLDPICFIALGYLDYPEQLEEPLLNRELSERSRKPVASFAFPEKMN